MCCKLLGTCKRREKSEILSEQDFPTKQHLVQSNIGASPSSPLRCKPRADGAVRWKIRSPGKAENKTPASRKLHGLFQEKGKNQGPWAKKNSIRLQSGGFHLHELPHPSPFEKTSIPSQLKAQLICCLSVHWSGFPGLSRDCSLLN